MHYTLKSELARWYQLVWYRYNLSHYGNNPKYDIILPIPFVFFSYFSDLRGVSQKSGFGCLKQKQDL